MRKHARSILLLLAVGLAAMVLIALSYASYFVWPPDFFDKGEFKTLAELVTDDGNRFIVSQMWGSDFYTSDFTHVDSDELTSTYLIDPDGNKIWAKNCEILEERGRITVVYFPLFGPRQTLCTYNSNLQEFRWQQSERVHEPLSPDISRIVDGDLEFTW